MKIDISELTGRKITKRHLDLQLQVSEVDFEGEILKFLTPITIDGDISSQDNIITLSINAKCELELTCSRCLEKFSYPVSVDINEKFSKMPMEDEEITNINNDIIDITEIVKTSIIMALPIKRLCSESCKGLCQQCGANLNINSCKCNYVDVDIRLAQLKDLFTSN
ncbi:YceD family protein [Clostridium frigidicarnis]|uniref:DUF177 domain-containing protein n=1 Tax=Clostridium frigidicarnis TaxID=84698 RepID=A0A1I0ZN56_9CLOT|nr:DUF177 domain-containing protein [Clostridium frigidicarnis]SFB27124.1 uncharacterized protein SAMN04488528_102330 [Clostridium frigidicarnis]